MQFQGKRLALLGIAFMLAASPLGGKERLSDSALTQQIINESIAAYPGNCPCPYNSARNGSRCGKRSAWNRAGGYAPLCFPSDISKADIATYRARN